MRQAVLQDDPRAVRDHAHSLHGSAATIGAHELEALCARLEQLARASTVVGAMSLVDALEGTYVRARTVLESSSPAVHT